MRKDQQYHTNVLIKANKVKRGIKKCADWINENFFDKDPVFLCVLNGSIVFNGLLFKDVNITCNLDTIAVKSYQGTKSNLAPKILKGPSDDITNRHLVIVEDIVDTGHTIKMLSDYLAQFKPKSISIITLLSKKVCRQVDVKVDYACFEIENVFINGCGMDYDGKFRNLHYIGVFNFDEYQKDLQKEKGNKKC